MRKAGFGVQSGFDNSLADTMKMDRAQISLGMLWDWITPDERRFMAMQHDIANGHVEYKSEFVARYSALFEFEFHKKVRSLESRFYGCAVGLYATEAGIVKDGFTKCSAYFSEIPVVEQRAFLELASRRRATATQAKA